MQIPLKIEIFQKVETPPRQAWEEIFQLKYVNGEVEKWRSLPTVSSYQNSAWKTRKPAAKPWSYAEWNTQLPAGAFKINPVLTAFRAAARLDENEAFILRCIQSASDFLLRYLRLLWRISTYFSFFAVFFFFFCKLYWTEAVSTQRITSVRARLYSKHAFLCNTNA